MSVSELNQEELEELRESYFQQLLETTGDEVLQGITNSNEIPFTNVIQHYEGVYFVKEDFFCNL